MGTGRGLMAIPGSTEGIHGDEGVTGLGGGGCHSPFWKPKNVHENSHESDRTETKPKPALLSIFLSFKSL